MSKIVNKLHTALYFPGTYMYGAGSNVYFFFSNAGKNVIYSPRGVSLHALRVRHQRKDGH